MAAFSSIAANSFVLAGSYILLSLGWVVIFRATQVLNFATGEMMALGAYIFYGLLVAKHLPLGLALPLAVVIAAVFAATMYVGVIKRLSAQPPYVIVILTFGISIAIEGVVAIIAGPEDDVLPTLFNNASIQLPGGAHLPIIGLVTTLLALTVVAILMAFLRFSSFGIQMRAAAELPTLASSSGINVNLIVALSWALAGIFTALGGISYGYTNVVSSNTSQLGLQGIVPALVGGFGSIGGTVAGSFLVAIIENTGIQYFGGATDPALIFGFLAIFILIRPSGIFGKAEIRRV
jgi:branched-chain amino acid transport system permease protein